jgi:hypothetical protein
VALPRQHFLRRLGGDAQKDLNLLIGNSSVAHMGFIFLGIASLNLIGVTGAVLIMIAHGFLAALTFALSGYIYQKTGTLEMSELGGLCRKLPFIGTALLMAAMAGCGLPGLPISSAKSRCSSARGKFSRLVTGLALWGALVIGAHLHDARRPEHPARPAAGKMEFGLSDASNVWRKLPYALAAGEPAGVRLLARNCSRKKSIRRAKIVAMANPGGKASCHCHFRNPKSAIRNPKLMNSPLITLEICVIALGTVLMLADFWMPAERKKFLATRPLRRWADFCSSA